MSQVKAECTTGRAETKSSPFGARIMSVHVKAAGVAQL